MKAIRVTRPTWLPTRLGRPPRTGETAAGRASLRGIFAWGFVSQVCSSVTTFGLTLCAGRLLGPGGLGVIVVGYAAYQLLIGLQRAVVTQPIVTHGAPLNDAERQRLARSGLTIVAASGLLVTLVAVAIGLVAGHTYGRSLMLFAPWICLVLLQDYWKTILFQEGRGGAAALSDFVRLGMTALCVPVAIIWKHDYVVVGMWGLGAAAGLAVAIVAHPGRPERLRTAAAAWRSRAWGLGRWLGGREIIYQVLTYVTVLTLTAILGTTGVGGFRSAEALFSPYSLVAAALVLPALPALSRAAAKSHDHAVALALRIGAFAFSVGMLYVGVMSIVGQWLFVHLFGHSFEPFANLIWPMAVSQALAACGVAFTLLLFAESRGVASFLAGLALSVSLLALEVTFALTSGVNGAAWGMAAAMGVGSAATIILALRVPSQAVGARVADDRTEVQLGSPAVISETVPGL